MELTCRFVGRLLLHPGPLMSHHNARISAEFTDGERILATFASRGRMFLGSVSLSVGTVNARSPRNARAASTNLRTAGHAAPAQWQARQLGKSKSTPSTGAVGRRFGKKYFDLVKLGNGSSLV